MWLGSVGLLSLNLVFEFFTFIKTRETNSRNDLRTTSKSFQFLVSTTNHITGPRRHPKRYPTVTTQSTKTYVLNLSHSKARVVTFFSMQYCYRYHPRTYRYLSPFSVCNTATVTTLEPTVIFHLFLAWTYRLFSSSK